MRTGQAMVCCLLLALLGCTGDPDTSDICKSLRSEHPSERTEAAIRAGQTRDRAVVPDLIERLNDPAADVRFYAIEALRRITGQTLDYRYYDEPDQRQPAIQRWRDWLRAQTQGGRP